MKIAVLILAHKNLEQLGRLIAHMKTDFDVYVHVNKNTVHHFCDEENVTFISERYAPYWGSDETPKAMLALLRAANKESCDYFMFISGQDLPLMSNKDIIKAIERNPLNYIYHHPLPKDSWSLNGGIDRVALYWPKKYEFKTPAGWLAGKVINFGFGIVRMLQKFTGLRRKYNLELWGGSMWLNLNRDAAGYILSYIEHNPSILKIFRFTRLSDEIIFHTILFGTGYKYGLDTVNDDMRRIDWQTGPQHPRIMTMADYEQLLTSRKFFGRKFDDSVDGEVIDKVLLAFS